VRQGDTIAAGLVVAASVVMGNAIHGIARGGGFRLDDEEGDYASLMQEQGDLDTWVAGVLTFGLLSLSLDAFAKFVGYYRQTGELMSEEQLMRQYEGYRG
jgi:hypothetical protein